MQSAAQRAACPQLAGSVWPPRPGSKRGARRRPGPRPALAAGAASSKVPTARAHVSPSPLARSSHPGAAANSGPWRPPLPPQPPGHMGRCAEGARGAPGPELQPRARGLGSPRGFSASRGIGLKGAWARRLRPHSGVHQWELPPPRAPFPCHDAACEPHERRAESWAAGGAPQVSSRSSASESKPRCASCESGTPRDSPAPPAVAAAAPSMSAAARGQRGPRGEPRGAPGAEAAAPPPLGATRCGPRRRAGPSKPLHAAAGRPAVQPHALAWRAGHRPRTGLHVGLHRPRARTDGRISEYTHTCTHTHTQWDFSQCVRAGRADGANMDERQKHQTRGKKTDTNRHVLHEPLTRSIQNGYIRWGCRGQGTSRDHAVRLGHALAWWRRGQVDGSHGTVTHLMPLRPSLHKD